MAFFGNFGARPHNWMTVYVGMEDDGRARDGSGHGIHNIIIKCIPQESNIRHGYVITNRARGS